MTATTIKLSSGEVLDVPALLSAAISEAVDIASLHRDPHDAAQAYAAALVAGLHKHGLIMVPRAHSRTREAVDANIYSMALSAKYDAERKLQSVVQLLGPLPHLGSLAHHVQDVIDALTGHAPPARAQSRLAALDERVRALRLVVFATPLDTPLSDPTPPESTEQQPGSAA